jgi:peptidoglycan/xylan/chitin deacetylase (PgdA/CDA1 family)
MRSLLVAAALLLGSCATPPAAEAPQQRLLAITVDDLPVHGPFPPGVTPSEVNEQLIAALRGAGVSHVHTFVNGHSLETNPETAKVLDDWREAGAILANHGWAHKNLNELSVADYEREILENEPLLARLGGDTDWHWYRYPFLAEGDDPAKRAEIREFLARHHYRIAGVSMSFSDWQWTAPYARCRANGDAAAVAELERMYMEAARADADYTRMVSYKLYGRDIPHVILLHVGAMTAHMMPRLLKFYRDEGFRFISLPEAEADPAYAADIDPRLPPRNQFFAARAMDQGIKLPPAPDYSVRLAAMCPGGGSASSTP